MTIRFDVQAVCRLCVVIGQHRPKHDAAEIAKAAAKLYRISVSLRNRGMFEEPIRRARALALTLDGRFAVDEDGTGHASACSIVFGNAEEVRII